jgi:hypothetical protein
METKGSVLQFLNGRGKNGTTRARVDSNEAGFKYLLINLANFTDDWGFRYQTVVENPG